MDFVKSNLWTDGELLEGGAIKNDLDYIPEGHLS